MSKVKIQGNASGTGVLTVTAPNTSTDRTITLPDATGTLATTADVPSSITDNGDATAITIDSSERVGVGTASPNHKLSVSGAGSQGTLGLYSSGTSNELRLEHDGGSHWVMNGVSDGIRFKASNSEKIRIDGDGLKFNGDTAAANALDDYEEGTWTPAIGVGSGITIGTTYASNYTKIGNVCTLSASFTLASSSVPGSGDVRITGFPFSFKSFPEGGYPIIMYYTYRETPNLFMHNAGYLYYQTSAVGGNNVSSVGNALDAVNYLSLAFSYITT